MNQNKLFLFGAIGIVLLIILSQVFYTVREDKQTLVLRFGEPVRTENAYGVEEDAGLKFKIPLIENYTHYDRKNLVLDLKAQPVLASDQERLLVDAFIRYRITDVKSFYEAFATRPRAEIQLSNVLDSLIRDVLGSVESQEIISGQRVDLMNAIETRANDRAEAGKFGLIIEDVRIKRADLPQENADRVMRAVMLKSSEVRAIRNVTRFTPKRIIRTLSSSLFTGPCKPTKKASSAARPMSCHRTAISWAIWIIKAAAADRHVSWVQLSLSRLAGLSCWKASCGPSRRVPCAGLTRR